MEERNQWNANQTSGNEMSGNGTAGTSNGTGDGWIHTDSTMRMVTPHMVRGELKAEGRNALLGHLGTAVGASVLYLLIVFALRTIVNSVLPQGTGILAIVLAEVLTLFVGVFAGIYEYGLTCIYMKLQYQKRARLADLFRGIRENQEKIIAATFIRTILLMLTMLPSLVAACFVTEEFMLWICIGLFAAGAAVSVYIELVLYPMMYLLLDYPGMPVREVLQKSKTMMKGHKWELFCLTWSFIPLWLLSLLTFGIAGLWVWAYRDSTLAAYYKKRMGA